MPPFAIHRSRESSPSPDATALGEVGFANVASAPSSGYSAPSLTLRPTRVVELLSALDTSALHEGARDVDDGWFSRTQAVVASNEQPASTGAAEAGTNGLAEHAQLPDERSDPTPGLSQPTNAEAENGGDWSSGLFAQGITREDRGGHVQPTIEALAAPHEVHDDVVAIGVELGAASADHGPIGGSAELEPPAAQAAEPGTDECQSQEFAIDDRHGFPAPPDGLDEAENDLIAFVAASEGRERIASVLEAVARRVQSGEIVVPVDAHASEAAVLASVLTALLRDT